MAVLARLRSLWRNIVHRSHMDRDLDEEVRAVFELLVDEHVREGLRPDQARRAATIALGRIESSTGQVREERAGALWAATVQDVRYGTRLLWRDPLFTLTAALSLAICIPQTSPSSASSIACSSARPPSWRTRDAWSRLRPPAATADTQSRRCRTRCTRRCATASCCSTVSTGFSWTSR